LERCVAGGSIFCAAGAVDADELARVLEPLVRDWSGARPVETEPGPPERGAEHLRQDTAQMHIGVAYDAPPEPDDDAILERLAVQVMGGSTSGRLFTEVRQKRSLCYSVGASYRAGRDTGVVAIYAGTTPERAQETLDVSIAEVERMREGISPDEFRRATMGLKSRLVMQGESTAARAGAVGNDFFRLGRARTLDEIAAAIDAVSIDRLNRYLADRRLGELSVVSLGPTELALPTVTT
jgi:predicted Zn-dependent peptidase